MLAAKEIHLKHQAPVINVSIIDRTAVPLPAPFEVENECARPPDMSGGHSVVICSEEQLKVAMLICCVNKVCTVETGMYILTSASVQSNIIIVMIIIIIIISLFINQVVTRNSNTLVIQSRHTVHWLHMI